MLFSSCDFLFLFLPFCLISLVIFRALNSRIILIYWLIILLTVYYIYWNPIDIAFIAVTILVNFFITRYERFSSSLKIWACVLFNSSYLVFFKILVSAGVGGGADIDSGGLFGSIGLPLGISFITFQQITFVVDNAEGKDCEASLVNYAFFVMFFPQLVSGPIVKHSHILPQTYRESFKRFNWKHFEVGLGYFGIGLAKKVLLADPMSEFNHIMFANTATLTIVEAWLNAFTYSLRIYFDFSAYADMAVGIGYMFGIRLPRNFNAPYRTTNFANFWRHWHITLYLFFREYVFKRLIAANFFRRRSGIAVLIVLVISGLWHGFGLGFLAWALGHCAGILLYRSRRQILQGIGFRIDPHFPDDRVI